MHVFHLILNSMGLCSCRGVQARASCHMARQLTDSCPGHPRARGANGTPFHPDLSQEQENGFFLSQSKGWKPKCVRFLLFPVSSHFFLPELFFPKPASSGWAIIQFFQMNRGEERRGEERERRVRRGGEEKGGERRGKLSCPCLPSDSLT